MVKQARNADITGQKFGRLTVIESSPLRKYGNRQWLCKCECGAQKVITTGSLRSGHSNSCGCLRKESVSARMKGVRNGYKHGHAPTRTAKQSPTYCSWRAMWVRCTNPNDRYYHRYGGRGIKVCEAWRDFEVFLREMGERPNGMTLDRINTDGNYEATNCRWADAKTQRANQERKAERPNSLTPAKRVAAAHDDVDYVAFFEN